jgi:catechol-2,3-dioxygenase
MTVAHLGHAELRVTDMERSRWFFTEVLGLYVSEETEEKVYLRAWQDWDHHTLILTRSDHPGVEHVGWRVEKPQDLGVHEKRLGELGIDHHWIESGEEAGQGDGLRSESGDRLASWLSRTSISHEIAVQRNRNQNGPLLHHAAYYLDSPDQLLRAATILADNDIEIEWGPGNHGTSGALFLYCFEPSGNRIEVWTGGFLIFAPDWEPIGWTQEKAELAYEFWGSAMPDTYLTYGTASHFTNVPARSASTPG